MPDNTAIGPLQPVNGKNSIGRRFMQTTRIAEPTQDEWIPPMDLNGVTKNTLMPAPASMNFSTLKNLNGTTYQAPPTVKKEGPYTKNRKGVNWNKANAFVNDASPYISNVVNSFRKPPMPAIPVFNSFTNLTKANYGTERDAVSRRFNADNKSIERNLDGNTAEAVKRFNRGQEEAAISGVNDRENRDNMTIANQQAGMDAQIKAMNTNLTNNYMNSKVEREIAHQREQSANVANFGDKVTLIGNEKRKAHVDLQKTRVLSTAFSSSGVYDRVRRKLMKQSGIDDPTGQGYKDLEEEDKKSTKKANGGFLHRLIKLN